MKQMNIRSNRYGNATLLIVSDYAPVKSIRFIDAPTSAILTLSQVERVIIINDDQQNQLQLQPVMGTEGTAGLLVHNSAKSAAWISINDLNYINSVSARKQIEIDNKRGSYGYDMFEMQRRHGQKRRVLRCNNH